MTDQPKPARKPRRTAGYTRGYLPTKGIRVPTRKGSERSLTPRVIEMVRLMVFEGMNLRTAAETAQLSMSAASEAMTKDAVKQYVRQQMDVFRGGAKASNIAIALGIRDDSTEPGKTRLDAARYIDGDEGKRSGVSVNIGVNVTPGYTVLAGEIGNGAELARILAQAGSSSSVLTGAVIDGEVLDAGEDESEQD